MAGETQKAKAEKLRALHAAGVLILPNAWDAGSAAMIALAGAQAIATTSGGIAWSAGRHDGQGLTRAEMTRRIREIVAAVTIPVTDLRAVPARAWWVIPSAASMMAPEMSAGRVKAERMDSLAVVCPPIDGVKPCPKPVGWLGR